MAADLTRLLGEVRERLEHLLDGACGDDERLFSGGRLDSVRLAETVSWISHRYGVDVAPEDLTLSNFDTPRGIANLVARKRPAR